jgi:hypothetical protein
MRTCEAIRTLHPDVLLMSGHRRVQGARYHQSQETVAVKRALMDSAAPGQPPELARPATRLMVVARMTDPKR